jgi:hypothetical protein
MLVRDYEVVGVSTLRCTCCGRRPPVVFIIGYTNPDAVLAWCAECALSLVSDLMDDLFVLMEKEG